MTALPTPIAARYQIAVLGGGVPTHFDSLKAMVVERVAEFGPVTVDGMVMVGTSDISSLSATAPTVAVYLGTDVATDVLEVERLVRSSTPVLPVVPSLAGVTSLVPGLLLPINAIAVDWAAPDFTEVVNLVLENLGLLRRTRRLFVSYFRRESESVAHQLRVAFDDAGYDPFLDTSSVPIGHDFQAVLWHRLLDSDVAVVLDTPNFLTSRWTAMEMAQAQAMSVGMVRVIWPGTTAVPAADLALPVQLGELDFSGDELTADAVGRVVTAAEAMRSRCLAARHENLVVEFCNEAISMGASTTIQPDRYVVATLPNGRRIAALPAVGVPDVTLYHDANRRFPSVSGGPADEAFLLYDHRGMSPSWTATLDWLDDWLPVRGLRVTDTSTKLRAIT